MSARAVFDDSYLTDLKALKARGMTIKAAAEELGMSYATARRLLSA